MSRIIAIADRTTPRALQVLAVLHAGLAGGFLWSVAVAASRF